MINQSVHFPSSPGVNQLIIFFLKTALRLKLSSRLLLLHKRHNPNCLRRWHTRANYCKVNTVLICIANELLPLHWYDQHMQRSSVNYLLYSLILISESARPAAPTKVNNDRSSIVLVTLWWGIEYNDDCSTLTRHRLTLADSSWLQKFCTVLCKYRQQYFWTLWYLIIGW